MQVQSRTNNINIPFYLDSQGAYNESEQTLLQDAGRLTVLKFGTVMAQVAATKKWVPYIDPAAVDGTGTPKGILVSDDIPFADLVAGDVAGTRILLGGNALLNEDLVVFETVTKDSIFAAATVHAARVEDLLAKIGIFLGSFQNNSELENA